MPEFLKLIPPAEARQRLLEALPPTEPSTEMVETLQALGRVLAADVRAPHPLPAFPRSTMDGYAVRAEDTFGASESIPAYLLLDGEVPMGAAPPMSLAPGKATVIHTGGMLPQNADAVVPLEQADSSRPGEVEVLKAVAKGENIIPVGEDVQAGQVVLRRGKRLRPAEIGGCMALGITSLIVAVKPRIGIISSGDEVIPPWKEPSLGQVRDVNSYSLSALVAESGGEPVLYGIIGDKLEVMKACARKALIECKAVVITAGSSASARDMTAEAIASLGEPGVLVHGVNIKPGKPTILAVCGGKPVIGLPGNPVSALVIARLFLSPLIKKLLGAEMDGPMPTSEARLSLNIGSQAGREDWVPVKLRKASEHDFWTAEPIFSKSNLIFSLSTADGLIRIPPDGTGLEAGERVEVILF